MIHVVLWVWAGKLMSEGVHLTLRLPHGDAWFQLRGYRQESRRAAKLKMI